MKAFTLLIILVVGFSAFAKEAKELTVYTSRKTHLIQPLFDAYTKKTGVPIKHINGKAGSLIQKIEKEGKSTPADLLVTVDAGNLVNATERHLFAPVDSNVLAQAVPTKLRDPENKWFSLSLRARTLFYNPKLVKEAELKSYQDLADSKWKNRLCLRTSRKVYNQSLVASLIERMGEKKAQKMIEGWVSNLAKPVYTSDTHLLEAIDKGICHVGIANTYYLARLVEKDEVKNVKVFWPEKEDGGVHVNVSGAGVIKHSDQKEQAIEFLEWLVTPEAQKMFAGLNEEYPVLEKVETSDVLKSWGSFEPETTSLNAIGRNQKKAVMLMDKAKYR